MEVQERAYLSETRTRTPAFPNRYPEGIDAHQRVGSLAWCPCLDYDTSNHTILGTEPTGWWAGGSHPPQMATPAAHRRPPPPPWCTGSSLLCTRNTKFLYNCVFMPKLLSRLAPRYACEDGGLAREAFWEIVSYCIFFYRSVLILFHFTSWCKKSRYFAYKIRCSSCMTFNIKIFSWIMISSLSQLLPL